MGTLMAVWCLKHPCIFENVHGPIWGWRSPIYQASYDVCNLNENGRGWKKGITGTPPSGDLLILFPLSVPSLVVNPAKCCPSSNRVASSTPQGSLEPHSLLSVESLKKHRALPERHLRAVFSVSSVKPPAPLDPPAWSRTRFLLNLASASL